jgi:hypothetical protein
MLMRVCAWCKREITRGSVAVGAPVTGQKYKDASHGHCRDCGEDFENGLDAATIAARASARAVGLVAVAPKHASGEQRLSGLMCESSDVMHVSACETKSDNVGSRAKGGV